MATYSGPKLATHSGGKLAIFGVVPEWVAKRHKAGQLRNCRPSFLTNTVHAVRNLKSPLIQALQAPSLRRYEQNPRHSHEVPI